jgi:hypothetical protein
MPLCRVFARADLRDAFDAAGDHRGRAVDTIRPARHRDRLQSRCAEAIDGRSRIVTGNPARTTACRAKLRPVVPSGVAAAQDRVLDDRRIDAARSTARAREGGEASSRRDVEFAAMRLGEEACARWRR